MTTKDDWANIIFILFASIGISLGLFYGLGYLMEFSHLIEDIHEDKILIINIIILLTIVVGVCSTLFLSASKLTLVLVLIICNAIMMNYTFVAVVFCGNFFYRFLFFLGFVIFFVLSRQVAYRRVIKMPGRQVKIKQPINWRFISIMMALQVVIILVHLLLI